MYQMLVQMTIQPNRYLKRDRLKWKDEREIKIRLKISIKESL